MSVILPEKVLKEVEKISRGEDTLPEEIVGRAAIEFLKLNDPETKSAGMLHQNFYENWLPKEMVSENIKDVKDFIKRLREGR